MSPKMDWFYWVAQQRMILQPTAVNQALCYNQEGEIHVSVIILGTGLALCQCAEVTQHIFDTYQLFGMSLSELHTSVTACACACVCSFACCMLACLFAWPTTYRKFQMNSFQEEWESTSLWNAKFAKMAAELPQLKCDLLECVGNNTTTSL